MTPHFFKQQIDRLSSHFGAQHFKVEKVKLIWPEVSDLQDKDFKFIVDQFIGNLNVDWPPKLDDFRVSAGAHRKALFAAQTKTAAGNLHIIAANDTSGSMDRYLQKLNAASLYESIALQKSAGLEQVHDADSLMKAVAKNKAVVNG